MTEPDLLAGVKIPHVPSARDRLIQFVAIADNTTFEFEIPGTLKDAENFIAHMRVELSRARDKMRNRGRKIRRFKMIVVAKDHNRAAKSTHVILRKHVNPQDELDLLATSVLESLKF